MKVRKINQSYGTDHKLTTAVSTSLIKLIYDSVGSICFEWETFLSVELKKKMIKMNVPADIDQRGWLRCLDFCGKF